MQIRLSPNNEGRLKSLMGIYREMCPDYDLSATQQCNLLLAGRLGLAIAEAEKEKKKNRNCNRCAPHD